MEKMIHADLLGVGNLLKQYRFSVPQHQRPYAWKDEQIDELFRDLRDAHKRNSEEYFLGTIVLADADGGRLSIIDGQQRLVTVTVLIAAIRDHFAGKGQSERAADIEREYLARRDIRSQEMTAHLFLIPEDRDFFVKHVVHGPAHPDRGAAPSSQAQERIAAAAKRAAEFVALIAVESVEPDVALIDLLEFMEGKALLIFVRVSNEANAFVIFEVLNDRGLDLSVADLLKNYVFRLAGDRLPEAHAAWQAMTTIITETADEPDVKNFIRQAWIARHGLTREKALYDAIKRSVKTKTLVVQYVKELAETAAIYAALRSPSHDRWKLYDEAVGDALEVFELVGVTQIRPLLLAVFTAFTPSEVNKAVPMMVGWTVRFLICGSGGSGTLETYYSERAKEVTERRIANASQLHGAMAPVLPSDTTFREAFAKATVSKGPLAKYYLRTLELQRDLRTGELVVGTDPAKVNLEHVMPQKRSSAWEAIPEASYSALVKRIGNFALLNSRMNSRAANSGFAAKKSIFAGSSIALTKDIADYSDWSESEIDQRQNVLAGYAVKAWSLKPRS